MNTILKPCPYCGGTAEHICNKDRPVRGLESIPGAYEGKYWHYVKCAQCNNQLSGLYPAGSDALIRQWNTRPVEDKMSAQALSAGRILCAPHELSEQDLDLEALAQGVAVMLHSYANECDNVERHLRKALSIAEPREEGMGASSGPGEAEEDISNEALAREASRLIFRLKEENAALRSLADALKKESAVKSKMYNAWLDGGKESREFKEQRESWAYADHAVDYALAALKEIEKGKFKDGSGDD